MEGFMAACSLTGPAVWFFGWGYRRVAKIWFDRQFIASASREGWTHIGTVKFMCVYPIDGGAGIKTDLAYFDQNGLQIYDDVERQDERDDQFTLRSIIPNHIYDRGFIIYSNSDPPTAILNDRYVIRTTDNNEEIMRVWKLLITTTNTLATPSAQRKTIQYLNRSIDVRIPSTLVFDQVKSAYNLRDGRAGGIGYFPQNLRKIFNEVEKRRLQNSAERFKPNYASFTMVNTKSVKDLRTKTGRYDLSYKNFRPQVVFEGKRPYIEENINALRIGNMEFTNVTPCVRDEDINLYFMPPSIGIFGEEAIIQNPYEYLTEHRPLGRLRGAAYQNLNGAVFGVNFDSQNPPENVEPAVDEDEDAIQVVPADEDEVQAMNPDATAYFRKFIGEGTQVFAKFD